MTRLLQAAGLFLALLLPVAALAGRPLNTEDATTLDERACQLETWIDRTRGNATDLSFAPACARFGIEWQAGAVRTRERGRSRTATTFFQGKHAFRSVDDGDWGYGLVAGLARQLRRGARTGWDNPFVIVPVSFGIGADKDTRALVHLNAGTTRVRDEARNLTLWGVAVEKPVGPRLALVAEAFGENAAKPFLRAGGRYSLFDRLDVDLTWVTRTGGEKAGRYWSLGFHWETEPFLP